MTKPRRVRKAVKTFNDWNGQAEIFYNRKTGDTWTSGASNRSQRELEHPDIITIRKKGGIGQHPKTSVREVKLLIEDATSCYCDQ